VAKIIDDTQERLITLELLSHDLFVEVKKKNEDELKAIFGNEAGKLLFDQAQCEDKFATVNILNGQNMEPLDSTEWMPEQRRAAMINARDIDRQIPRLIRIFQRKEMRDKLHKEFGFVYKNSGNSSGEIEAFNNQFKLLKKLWWNKLCTPLEEVTSQQELLIKLRQSTGSLAESLRMKEDAYQKFQEQAKEQKEQRQKELEDLKDLSVSRKTEKTQKEEELRINGEAIQKQREQEHLDKKKDLQT
jgi:hypothetical protein